MNLFEFNLALPITDPTWVFFLVLIIILFAPMILGRLHIPVSYTHLTLPTNREV